MEQIVANEQLSRQPGGHSCLSMDPPFTLFRTGHIRDSHHGSLGPRSPVVFWSFQPERTLRSRFSQICQVHQVPVSQRVLHHSYTGLIEHLQYSLTFFTVTDQIAL